MVIPGVDVPGVTDLVSPLHGFTRLQELDGASAVPDHVDAVPALALTAVDPRAPRNHLGGFGEAGRHVFAGSPSRPVGSGVLWPTDAAGNPLTHVLSVDLDHADTNHADIGGMSRLGAPTQGVLQIFHDLETYGNEADDRNSWCVRLLAQTIDDRRDEWELMTRPDGGEHDEQREPVALDTAVILTIPSPLDVELERPHAWDRYSLVHKRMWFHGYELSASRPEMVDAELNTWWNDAECDLAPPSHVLGQAIDEQNPDIFQQLEHLLPLKDADRHVLLAEVVPHAYGEDFWFHGGRKLQVWMRESDLSTERFDKAWCLIRTDLGGGF